MGQPRDRYGAANSVETGQKVAAANLDDVRDGQIAIGVGAIIDARGEELWIFLEVVKSFTTHVRRGPIRLLCNGCEQVSDRCCATCLGLTGDEDLELLVDNSMRDRRGSLLSISNILRMNAVLAIVHVASP